MRRRQRLSPPSFLARQVSIGVEAPRVRVYGLVVRDGEGVEEDQGALAVISGSSAFMRKSERFELKGEAPWV